MCLVRNSVLLGSILCVYGWTWLILVSVWLDKPLILWEFQSLLCKTLKKYLMYAIYQTAGCVCVCVGAYHINHEMQSHWIQCNKLELFTQEKEQKKNNKMSEINQPNAWHYGKKHMGILATSFFFAYHIAEGL